MQARWLPCQQHGAILGRAGKEGPRDGRRVAHDLRASDEVLEGLRGLEVGQRREAVRGYQVDVGELHLLVLNEPQTNGPTHQMVRHLRARVGGTVGLVHAVHGVLSNATVMPLFREGLKIAVCTRDSWTSASVVSGQARSARQGVLATLTQQLPIRLPL